MVSRSPTVSVARWLVGHPSHLAFPALAHHRPVLPREARTYRVVLWSALIETCFDFRYSRSDSMSLWAWWFKHERTVRRKTLRRSFAVLIGTARFCVRTVEALFSICSAVVSPAPTDILFSFFLSGYFIFLPPRYILKFLNFFSPVTGENIFAFAYANFFSPSPGL